LNNIVLIGYRGSGKTTVGRLLASRLGRPFVDSDALIEAEAGRSIADIFATQGEQGFRQRERRAIARLAQADSQVLSVGGGAVLNEANVDRLRAGGTIVWLTAPAEVLWDRISEDTDSATMRPELTPDGGLEEVRALLAAREPAYRAAADLIVATSGRSPEEVVAAVLGVLAEIDRE
jgi:shikimate kinase